VATVARSEIHVASKDPRRPLRQIALEQLSSARQLLLIAGAGSLLIGAIVFLFFGDLRQAGVAGMVIGRILLIASIAIAWRQVSRFVFGQRGLYGANTLVIVIAIGALAGIINYSLVWLTDRPDPMPWLRWDATATKLPPFHTAPIDGIDFSPDGNRLVSKNGQTFRPRGANYVRLTRSPKGYAYHSTFEPGQYDQAAAKAREELLVADRVRALQLQILDPAVAACLGEQSLGLREHLLRAPTVPADQSACRLEFACSVDDRHFRFQMPDARCQIRLPSIRAVRPGGMANVSAGDSTIAGPSM
jgi:hypothetical protein